MKTIPTALHRSLGIVAAVLLVACADEGPVTPDRLAGLPVQFATLAKTDTDGAVATLRRATARYHNLRVAINEGFVLLHECETRPGEGPVGAVFVHLGRLMDGIIDPERPDALIYEPSRNERPKLVGAEFAIPYALWTQNEPPAFLGHRFQREDEFGVFALHAWIWRANPEGMFAESNPRVSCGVE